MVSKRERERQRFTMSFNLSILECIQFRRTLMLGFQSQHFFLKVYRWAGEQGNIIEYHPWYHFPLQSITLPCILFLDLRAFSSEHLVSPPRLF